MYFCTNRHSKDTQTKMKEWKKERKKESSIRADGLTIMILSFYLCPFSPEALVMLFSAVIRPLSTQQAADTLWVFGVQFTCTALKAELCDHFESFEGDMNWFIHTVLHSRDELSAQEHYPFFCVISSCPYHFILFSPRFLK